MHYTPFSRSIVCDPDTLKNLGETFDSAWAAIAGSFESRTRDAARLRLATAILELGANSDCSLLELKCRAIGAMKLKQVA